MAVAEAIAAISAALQAIDLYAKYGGSRDQVIQTLNLEYRPTEYQQVETRVLAIDPAYEQLFNTAKGRVEKCISSFKKALDSDDHLPDEREKFGTAARSCVCREIKLLKDFMAGDLPPELEKIWQKHKCGGPSKPAVREFVPASSASGSGELVV